MSPAEPARPRLRRGGARNRADRITQQLSAHDCGKVLSGAQAAWDCGAPLTRFITLAWEHGGADPRDCVKLTGQFIAMAHDWLAARGHPMAWVWTQEAGQKYGAHAHALFHVPKELDSLFRTMPCRWAKHVLGGHYRARTVKCEALQYRAAAYTNPPLYWAKVNGKLHYMLKCAPAELEGPLGLTGWGHENWGKCCKVYGKRAGVWQQRRAKPA